MYGFDTYTHTYALEIGLKLNFTTEWPRCIALSSFLVTLRPAGQAYGFYDKQTTSFHMNE